VAHERLDPALLSVLAAEVVPLTAAQLRGRCSDPWAPALVDEWLREAFDRGLVNVRRQSDLPSEWKLTKKGERAARRLPT
jgi:hypothetical protein